MGAAVGLAVAWVVENAALAAAIAMSVMSVAMTLMMKPKMPNQARGQAERKQVLRSSNAPVDWVYGHTVKSGLLAFAEEEVGGWQDEGTDPEANQGFVEWLHEVIVLAGHPVDRIGRIWFNDDEIQTYGSKAAYELLNNPQTANQFLLDNCPSWKPDMILKGLASLRVSMLFDQQKYSAGIPNVKVEVWGKQVFDPRDNQTKWSDNAALVLLDFIRHHPKMMVADNRIDWEAFKHAATICDEIVTDPKGKLEKRYTINGCIDLNERPASTIDDMLAAMAGELTWFGGLIGVQAGAYYGPATVTINSGDIISNIDITPESSSRERLNTVQGTFIDPEQMWVETDYPAVQVAEWLEEDGQEQSQDLKLRFVSSYYQAQRLANVVLRRNRLGQTLSFTMNLKGYAVMPGSYVRLKVPEIEIDREFRVVEWEHDPIGGTVKLTVREDGIAIWDDLIGKPINRPPLVNLPSGGPAIPSDLTFQVETIGEVVQGVLTWRNSAMTAYTNINIIRGNTTIYTAQEPRNLHRLGGLPVGDYVAEMRAVGMTGGMSDKATIAFSVATPAAVTAVDIRAGNWDITLTPRLATTSTYGTEFEFFYYRNPLQIADVEATAQRLGYGAQLTHSGLQTGTVHYYWVRAINAYGKGQLYALEATTTRDVDSVLDVISGSIGADDLIEELRVPLEETIDMWTAKVGNTDIGKYGGIGLTIEQDPDGVWRTKCIVDADVFAILDPSGATGEGSQHPFVVKDGIVYINKLLLDDAEIGSVIAKYINVQDLVAVNITASTIKSSDNGASFSLLPDGTMSCTKATIKGAITATSGSFTGTVNANAGTMNNITIAENCNVLGTIYAERIVGDVASSKPAASYPVSGSTYDRHKIATVLIAGAPNNRTFNIFGLRYGISRSDGYTGGSRCWLRLKVNGIIVASHTEFNVPNSEPGIYAAPMTVISGIVPASSSTQTVTVELYSDTLGVSKYSTFLDVNSATIIVTRDNPGTFIQ